MLLEETASRDIIADPATYALGPPHEVFAELRRDSPVAWINESPLRRHSGAASAVVTGGGFWAVSRYDTIIAASRAPEIFSSSAGGPFLADPSSRADLERTRQLLVGLDAPEHSRLRKIVTTALTAGMVRDMRDSVRAGATAIVARVTQGEPFDVVADVAAELPLLVLADLLGMPRGDRGLLLRWSNHLVGFDDPEFGGGDIELFKKTFIEAFGYALDLARHRRKAPAGDLVSRLVTGDHGGDRLSESEFCHLWILLVVAGNESTRHLLSGSLELLADQARLRRELAAGTAAIPAAVDELLRWITPLMQFRRTAVHDTTLDGQAITAGDKVVLYYISANRDATAFQQADQVVLGRKPNPHLAFGSGPHFCLGARLARLEACILLEELAPHLPRLRRTGPTVRLASNVMNGIKSLPASFAAG